MTNDATLDFRGDEWVVEQDGRVLDRYPDEQVRLSLSWTAWVGAGAIATIDLDDVFARMADSIGSAFVAASADELFAESPRHQLHERWPGYLPD